MNIFNQLVVIFWLVLLVVWLISALVAKKPASGYGWGGRNWRLFALTRLIIVFVVIILIETQSTQHFFLFFSVASLGLSVNWLGVALCFLGISLAIWARVYLGRNWGFPMSLKREPELVTTGPYRFIRHPIYAGVLLAVLGSALAASLVWIIVFIAYGAYFLYSARVEEKNMQKLFPEQYPAYMKRTKRIIPFVY